MRKSKWEYVGDVNIQHGGYYWSRENAEDDYVDAVRVEPCSDAGGPDNMFWVTSLVVCLPRDIAERDAVLDSCGWVKDGSYAAADVDTKLAMLVDACIGYGKYDQEHSELVRIGKDDPFFDDKRREWTDKRIDVQLRGGSSLRNYVTGKYIPFHK